ncbi:MAG: M3 family metallopeptidase [Myxococcales bacterium]|nr:M3 family metallopeptidase [Myxococcales bacterium]MCB9716306.1 M3 family metallopeptidase [Myxococcales bacterium]
MADLSDNPLLDLGLEVPFDRIEAAHVEPAIETLLARARRAIARIVESGPRTYDGTLQALDTATEGLERAMGVVGHLESVATNDALREAYNAVLPEVSAFYSSIPLDEGLYAALHAAAEAELERLDPTRRRHLSKTLDDFRRHGAELPAEGKARLSEIDVELSKITTRYAQNVLDSTNAFELLVTDEAELAGLPPSALDAARASAEAKGQEGWRFTLQSPSYIAVMTYLDHAAYREQVWRAFNTRACAEPWDNRELIGQILQLRREKATLLGYGSFADLVLEDRMAKTGAKARAFVEDLRQRSRDAFVAENEALLAFRREVEGPQAPALRPWDVGYWAEKQRRARYDFDEEALRPYFPLASVLQGMFDLVRHLYGVSIALAPEIPTWHESVDGYRIRSADDEDLGVFYVDSYPRETKRDGAWMNGLVTGELGPSGMSPHLALICANVTPPVGDRPALLTHHEVETLFHEFGHLMHHMLSRVEVRSLGGTNVAWDFVELPSQIMENWCWEKQALDTFARHWQTGETIPDELFTKLDAARTYRAANAMMRQLGFATVDLVLHMDIDPAEHPDLLAVARKVLDEHAAAPLPEDYGMIASFGHLFAHPVGYAAAYYSYKWAEVLDADAFTRFRDEGLYSPEVGAHFRDAILAKGDSRDPMELYVEFMGREPSVRPLLDRSGLG